MSIQLIAKESFKRDVEITTPVETTIKVEGVEFKYLTEKAWKAVCDEHGDDAIKHVVLGWDRFLDAHDEPIEFSKENLNELMEHLFITQGFAVVYQKAIYGLDTKNFAASLAFGQIQNRAARKEPSKKPKARKPNSKR